MKTATAFVFLCLASTTAAAVSIDTVTVSNPNNAPDSQLHTQNNSANLLFGAVSYVYHIGLTEVTNGQYVEFLNAVAKVDTHGLFNTFAETNDPLLGITRSGSSGAFSYSTKANMGDKPVNFVGYWDSVRFANWLDNGQPAGAQDSTTTEDGSYTLGGITNPTNGSVLRNADATWFIPTENEWYKAAYYDPNKSGGPGYYDYPTSSDIAPTAALANMTGDVSNPGSNIANYGFSADWNGHNGNVTTVGSTGSVSPYSTLDQGGNLGEWTETLVPYNLSPPLYAVRGGTYRNSLGKLHRETRGVLDGGSSFSSYGFRVATIPEPTTFTLAAFALLGFAGFSRRSMRRV